MADEKDDSMEEKKESTDSGSSYGKKNWGKWILIYIVAAIVVYGIIYYVVANNSSGTDSLYSDTSTTTDQVTE